MTLCVVLNMSKLYCYKFASVAHCFAAARRVSCPMLCPRRLLTVSAVARCSAMTDAENKDNVDSNEAAKKRTVRWLPRNKKVRVKYNRQEVVEKCNDPSISVLVDMLASHDSESSESHNTALNTVRTEIDEKLKELDEMSNIRIQDIHLAMEMDDEETEKTEVCLWCCCDNKCCHTNAPTFSKTVV